MKREKAALLSSPEVGSWSRRERGRREEGGERTRRKKEGGKRRDIVEAHCYVVTIGK